MKEIPGFNGYFADELGVIYSNHRGPMIEMKLRTSRGGYSVVALYVGKRRRYKYALVHRLILSTFSGTPAEKMDCNHKNGIRTDNRLENLEWLTRKENERHARKVLHKKLFGAYHPCSKLTDVDASQIRILRDTGMTLKSIAEKFGIGISQTARIIKREKWSHVR